MAELEAQVATHQAEEAKKVAALTEQVELLKGEATQLREKLGAAKGGASGIASNPSGEAPTEGEQSEAGAGSPAAEGRGGFMKGIAKMFTDPEMKKMMRTQQGVGVRMMYGDLARELGLAPEEANQIMELLTERQLEQAASGMKAMEGGEMDEAKMKAIGETTKASKQEYDKQLKNILGPERFAKMEEYERTIVDRMTMTQMQQQFTASGTPLEPKQSQGLLRIMSEERAKAPATVFDQTNKDPGAQLRAMQSGTEIDAHFASQMEINRRVLERAPTVLSPDQVNALAAAQKQQLEMQQMGMKMGREMMKGSK